MSEIPDFGGLSSSRESDIRAAIGSVLANKFKAGAGQEATVLKGVLDFWANWLKESASSTSLDATSFRAGSAIGLNVIAGAAARQDPQVLTLIPALHSAASSPTPNGEILAFSLGLIVKPSPLLTRDNHAITRLFHKQWIYAHLAKPLLQPAQPGSADPLVAARYRVAVLSVLPHCPFTIYQDDLPALIRLLVTALTSQEGWSLSADTISSQTIAALEVLIEILGNEPATLAGHVGAVIKGVTKVYQENPPLSRKDTTAGSGSGVVTAAKRAVCRRLALQVLAAVPGRFEERHVRAYVLPTQKMLAVACGDPVRRVREVARLARAGWARAVQGN